MSDQNHTGKGFLREKLGDYRVNPPESVWNAISSQLGGRGRRKMIIIVLSAAATIALAVTLGLNWLGPDQPLENGRAVRLENDSQIQGNRDPGIAAQPGQENEGSREIEALQESERTGLQEKVIRALEAIEEQPSHLAMEEPEEVSRDPYTDEGFTEQQVSSKEPVLPMDADNADISGNGRYPRNSNGINGDGDLPVEEDPADQVAEIPAEPDMDAGPGLIPDQNEEFLQDTRPDPRWIVGAALSPLYSFRDAESSAMASGSEFESGLVAYAGGVHVSYRTASRLAIESGIYFNKMGISIGASGIQQLNQSFDISPLAQEAYTSNITTVTNSVGNIVARSGEVYVNNYKLNAANQGNELFDNSSMNAIPANQGIRQHLDYLELPFNVRYTLIDRSIELQLVGGMSTNFLVNNYVTMETSMGPAEIGYLTNIRSVNYSGNAGIGMIYHLGEQLSLRMEPRFRYFLNSVNDNTLPSTRPYTFGLFTGMNFTF